MINPNQINIRLLFSVKDILLSRGFKLLSENDLNDTLISGNYNETIDNHKLFNSLFQIFHSVTLRNELLRFIENNTEPKNHIVSDLVKSERFLPERHLFSNSFEWFIGELMVRKFSAFSYSFGTRINEVLRNSDDGNVGDYDTLVVQRNTNLIYFECKTGRYDRRAIMKSIERSISLHTEFIVFFIMGSINETKLSDCLINADYPNFKNPRLLKVNIKTSDVSIYKWHNCYFISGEENIEEQLRTVLRINQAKKIMVLYQTEIEDNLYSSLGYHIEEI
jgi:hypothetical protein